MLIDEIKTSLRINKTNTAFDSDEIEPLIDAARQELKLSGILTEKVDAEDNIDPLVKRAVTTYVKANFGWDNPDSDRLNMAFEMLKQHLSLSQEFTMMAITFSITDGTNPLSGALINFDGNEKITDSNGKVIFYSDVKQGVTYSVSKNGYVKDQGTIDVFESQIVSVSMTEVI